MNNIWSTKKTLKILICFNILIFSAFSNSETNVTKTEKDLISIKKEINQLDKNIKKNTATKNSLSNELKRKEKKMSVGIKGGPYHSFLSYISLRFQ